MIFICYSRKDITVATCLVNDLQSKGIETWIDYVNLDMRNPIKKQLEDAIKKCEKVIVICSESSIKSRWVRYEKEIALKNNKIIEIRNVKSLI
jgi:histidyl-tRNA synthetase